MKTTTTRMEEVMVCSDCREDIRGDGRWHWFVCPRCLETFCHNMKATFSVEVRENTPRNYPDTSDRTFGLNLGTAPAHSVKYLGEFAWRGDYCVDCAEHVRSVLTAAGLIKFVSEPEATAVCD